MKKCEGCGAIQPDEASVCEVCGASMEEVSKTVTLTLMQAVIAYQAGDNDAFQTIYDETEKSIYASILKVVGSYVNAQAMIEDIMKATYMEIGRSLGQLERPEKFVDWANKVATRNCFAFLNANQPNPYWYELPYGMGEQLVGERILPNSIEQDVAVQNSVRMIIEQQFTSMEKFCVVSHYYNGIAIEELSQSIGIPSESIVRNLNSAKTKLCRSLMETEREKSTGMSELTPWIQEIFKQDAERIMVPRNIREMIKNAIAGVVLGMPGALTSGVVLTGAVHATGSVTVGSAMAGTGLSSIAGTVVGGTAMGGAAMGGAAMGGAAMGGAAMGGTAMGSAAMGGAAMGAAANTGAGMAAGTVAGANAAGVGSVVGTGAANVIGTGAVASSSGVISTGAVAGSSGVISTGAVASSSGVISTGAATASSAGTNVASVTIVDSLGGAGAAAGGTAAGSGASAGIFSTLGAKIAVAVAGAAVVTGGGLAIHHAVTSNNNEDTVALTEQEVEYGKDNQLYRITCDYDQVQYTYENGSVFAALSIVGTEYQPLAGTLATEMNRYRAEVEARIEEQTKWALELGYDDAKYAVNFKVSRADENVFSCLSYEVWNTYTDVTMWSPFVTIDAKTGEILELDDLCDVTELKSYVMDNMDDMLADITEKYDYSGGAPEQIKEIQVKYWERDGVSWYLSAEGIGVYIDEGVPVQGGQWTMMVPYDALSSFNKNYLPKGVISSDLTADIGITVMPNAFSFDTNGDGKCETYDQNGGYREYFYGHGSYFVRNANNQCFFVVPNQSNDDYDGTRVYLITDNGEQEVTNDVALELNICSMSGDIAYCHNIETGSYMYYQITEQGMLPWNSELKNHKYELVEEQITWEEAKEIAEKRGGHLVTITSEAEQIYVESIAKGNRCWIGAYCDENHENWQWVTGEPWEYTNWAEGEPSVTGVLDDERYATIWPRKWNDLGNESYEQSGYIIEWD